MFTKSLCIDKPLSEAARNSYDGANARVLIALCFQDEINAGRANWHTSDDGQTELRLNSGEVFLLQENIVTRLK